MSIKCVWYALEAALHAILITLKSYVIHVTLAMKLVLTTNASHVVHFVVTKDALKIPKTVLTVGWDLLML